MKRRSGNRPPRINRRSLLNRFAQLDCQFLERREMLAWGDSEALVEPIAGDVFSSGTVSTDSIIQRARMTPFIPGQIVVAVEHSVPKSQVNPIVASIDWSDWTGSQNVSVIRNMMTVDRGPGRSVSLVHLNLGKESNPIEVMYRLTGQASVLWSSPNFYHAATDPRDFTPNDPQYGAQYHHTRMQNNLAWDITLGNPSIRIGVTDDGVSLPHQDLQPNIWINPGEIPGNSIDDDSNGYIDDVNGWDFSSANNDPNPNGANDHGTHVAGITAGRTHNAIGISGTAGLATIVPMQFYLGTSSWTAAIINETYRYAADNSIQIVTTSYNVDGWVGDPVFLAGLQYMYDAGVLHFNSAGNNNQLNPPRQVFDQSLFVASTDSADLKSSFSNYGTGIDIAAPGSNILATVLNNGYGTKSGTSMSTPNAAGAAALVWGQNPGWSRDQVAAQLLFFADNIDTLNPTFAGLLGTGRANSFRALSNTLPAPRVKSLTGLPAAGSTTATWNIQSFTVAFNQVMNPASVNSNSNYALREAGADGNFGTGDDQLIGLTRAKTYQIGTNSLGFNINGGPLGPGKYQLQMVSGGLQNPFSTALDGNGDGTGGDHYLHAFTLAPDTIKLSTPGSLVHQQSWSASIATAGQKKDYFISLDAGQTLTVTSRSAGSLQPTIEVRDPAGALIGSGNAIGSSSATAVLAVTTAGRYRITFGGNGSTVGAYNAMVLLNSAAEIEDLGGPANNSFGTAQNIDSSVIAPGTGMADRLAVTGRLPGTTGTPVHSDGFESGSLGPQWTTSTSSTAGRIRVSGAHGTAAGSFALLMDTSVDNSYSRNEATWTVNMTGLASPTLRFFEAGWNDEVNTMPVSFVGNSNTDGVAISADGNNWFRVWSPTATQPAGIWTERTVDLAAAAASAGITLGANFRVRFQQYDNYTITTDGRGYDSISINVPETLEDWYAFTLADGESAAIAASRTGSVGSVSVSLYDSAGALVRSGVAATNISSYISRHQDTTTNGSRDLWYVRVTGVNADYTLSVVRNGEFDREANNAADASAQDISGLTGMLGFADTAGDFYRLQATTGDVLSFNSFVPGNGPDLFVNGLGSSGGAGLLRMRLLNPAGAIVASGDSNVTFTSDQTGTWYLQVYAQSGTGGEYFVEKGITAIAVDSGMIPMVVQRETDVSFNRTFVDPIVIVSVPTVNGSKSSTLVGITDVTSTGFRIYISAWGTPLQAQTGEEISYMVFERGVTTLPNGSRIVAGSLAVDDSGFYTENFPLTFSATPVVVTTTVARAKQTPRAVRFDQISASGFQVRTQFQENRDGASTDFVQVNYLAMLPGRYSGAEFEIEAGRAANPVNHIPSNLNFSQPFGGVPVFAAAMQTFNDSDPAALRLPKLAESQARIYVQEEQSLDDELSHGNETLGYIALHQTSVSSFSAGGNFPDAGYWTMTSRHEDQFALTRQPGAGKSTADVAFAELDDFGIESLATRLGNPVKIESDGVKLIGKVDRDAPHPQKLEVPQDVFGLMQEEDLLAF
jgi:subtilisin family serine protease